ncbi:MAG: DUF6489 family protein [Arenicellales bacterium]|jgi:hypothetical protein|nr:DUF6489 family protein [Arenicellales bacterium]
MKFKIEIECPPDEAREFFGLPNVEKLNSMMMTALQETISSQINTMDPETLMKTWMPAVAKSWETFPEQLFAGFSPKMTEEKEE